MDRQKLARLIWKLWKQRNWYKKWYEYEKNDNNAWNNHYEQRMLEWQEAKNKRRDHENT
jgi:hypothetical protein